MSHCRGAACPTLHVISWWCGGWKNRTRPIAPTTHTVTLANELPFASCFADGAIISHQSLHSLMLRISKIGFLAHGVLLLRGGMFSTTFCLVVGGKRNPRCTPTATGISTTLLYWQSSFACVLSCGEPSYSSHLRQPSFSVPSCCQADGFLAHHVSLQRGVVLTSHGAWQKKKYRKRPSVGRVLRQRCATFSLRFQNL